MAIQKTWTDGADRRERTDHLGRVDGVELPIRRSRGYAPLPVALPVAVPPTLAVGADLKNTWPSPTAVRLAEPAHRRHGRPGHVVRVRLGAAAPRGADRRRTRKCLSRTHTRATGPRPGRTAMPADRPVRTVQHHHAHIAAVMAEHGLDGSEQVLGFAFDGTGYGPDGAVWGGEVLLADYKGYRRLAHLKYVPLAGGDVSVLRPYRMALAHLWAAGLAWDPDLAPVRACPADERGCCATSSRPGWAALRHPAWAGCSTRCRRWPASGRSSPTRRRPRSSWRACPATVDCGATDIPLRHRRRPSYPRSIDPGPGASRPSSPTPGPACRRA